jgi:hypothetical protein
MELRFVPAATMVERPQDLQAWLDRADRALNAGRWTEARELLLPAALAAARAANPAPSGHCAFGGGPGATSLGKRPARPGAGARAARQQLGWQPQFPELDTLVAHAWGWEQKVAAGTL